MKDFTGKVTGFAMRDFLHLDLFVGQPVWMFMVFPGGDAYFAGETVQLHFEG